MRKILKYLGRTLLFVILFMAIYMAAAYILPRITVHGEATKTNEVTIHILTNGIHTDIVVPARSPYMDWTPHFRYADTQATDTTCNYLALGWGDKGFYLETPTWADLTPRVAACAAFGLGTTAIHATYYPQMTLGDSCRAISISRDQYTRLCNYILQSLQRDKDNRTIHIITTANYGKNDAFYEAQGSYSLFHTCNTWSNNALKTSGLRACLWTPFDTGIFLKYE